MIELVFSTALSAALIASATIPMLADRTRRRVRREALSQQRPQNIVDAENVDKMIRNGYAYTVDLGDSFVVVVVFNKRTSTSFYSAVEEPLDVMYIDGVPQIEAIEATT